MNKQFEFLVLNQMIFIQTLTIGKGFDEYSKLVAEN